MLTKFKDSNDMNTVASDAIHSYIKDGYRIDAKESVIDRDKDKDCTFKAVLKKEVDGIECKSVITLTDNGDDKNKCCTYHKVDTVGDTKWSEETRTFSFSQAPDTLKEVHNKVNSYTKHLNKLFDEDDWLTAHRRRMKRISDKYGFGWDWFADCYDKHFKRLSDVIKTPKDSFDEDKDTKWECKCPSAYDRLSDYIESDKFSDDDKTHIKVNAKDSVDDLYNKIVDSKKNLEDACSAKKRKDEDHLDDVVSQIKVNAATDNSKAKTDNKPKQEYEDDLEDSLIKLVRYIFGK
jgi:hypothetical protein